MPTLRLVPSILALTLLAAGVLRADDFAPLAPVQSASQPGVTWVQDLTQARSQAARKEHPLLVFQLLGDLDQEFC